MMKITDAQIWAMIRKAEKQLDQLETDLIRSAIDAITENKPLLNSEKAVLKKFASLMGLPEHVFFESVIEEIKVIDERSKTKKD